MEYLNNIPSFFSPNSYEKFCNFVHKNFQSNKTKDISIFKGYTPVWS